MIPSSLQKEFSKLGMKTTFDLIFLLKQLYMIFMLNLFKTLAWALLK